MGINITESQYDLVIKIKVRHHIPIINDHRNSTQLQLYPKICTICRFYTHINNLMIEE